MNKYADFHFCSVQTPESLIAYRRNFTGDLWASYGAGFKVGETRIEPRRDWSIRMLFWKENHLVPEAVRRIPSEAAERGACAAKETSRTAAALLPSGAWRAPYLKCSAF